MADEFQPPCEKREKEHPYPCPCTVQSKRGTGQVRFDSMTGEVMLDENGMRQFEG